MTFFPAARRRLSTGATAFALAGLSACASAQKPPPTVPAGASAAPAPIVTMAPIANPEHAAPARREPAAPPHARSSEGVAAHRAAARSSPPAAPPAPSLPGVDPAAAARLRARGLEELNRGAVAKAVALLTQASRLDPGSAVIRRDLDRAERIDRAVHGPH